MGRRQAAPPLRAPSKGDLGDLARTCGPATALYVAKNACYIVLQAAATALSPLAVAAHQPVRTHPCLDLMLRSLAGRACMPASASPAAAW